MSRSTPSIPPKLAKQAVALAMDLHRRALWQEFGEEHAFAVRLPDDEEPWYLSLLGQAGQQFGVGCYGGPGGLGTLREIVFVGGDDSRSLRCELLAITIDRQQRTPEPLRDIYRAAGHSESLAPTFLSSGPDRVPRSARGPELRRAVAILRALLVAHDRGLLRASLLAASGPSRLLTLTVDGDVDVRAAFEDHAVDPEELQSGVLAPPGLAALPRHGSQWAVGFRRSAAAVEDDPTALFTLLVHDPDLDMVLDAMIIAGEDTELAATHMFNLMQVGSEHSEPGLPGSIDFANRRLHDAVAPALAEVAVDTRFEPDQPKLDELFDSMNDALAGESDEDLPPLERNLLEVAGRLGSAAERRGALTPRRRAEFFGDADNELDTDAANNASFHWTVLDYRPSPRHRTLAERVLDSDLPDAERDLLKAMVDAAPALYRIERMGEEDATISDLFGGQEIDLDFAEFDADIAVGTILGGRVCVASEETFAIWITPPIPEVLATGALAHLEANGMELSHEGVASAPHLLGRLFGWLETSLERGIRMTNTDGDPLRLQSASFVCAEPEIARRYLEVRDDVDHDEEEGSWTWFREESSERRTVLARIQGIDDRLVVDLNSDRRLARVRAWLEDVPGVHFESATEIDADAAHPSRAAPAEPIEMTPDLVAHLQEMISARYREWIDEEIPALDGLTPRQAVKTADGRRRVELLIRTMPDPAGMPGVVAPREEVRRELGLDTE